MTVITTYEETPTKTIDIGGVMFAYRRLGPDNGPPVIFLNHLAAVLDNWDPRVVDGIAARHQVITFDNRGVGASQGRTPRSVAAMAQDAIAFIRALGYDQVDLLGFSLGGFVAQLIAAEEPGIPQPAQSHPHLGTPAAIRPGGHPTTSPSDTTVDRSDLGQQGSRTDPRDARRAFRETSRGRRQGL